MGHLCGYVGPASAEDYQRTHDPLYITPGFKVGKENLEKVMEPWLRGTPGAKRTEVTAHGRLVQELTTKPEQMGHTLRLTIDAPLQEYAARRLGPNSGSVVVVDTEDRRAARDGLDAVLRSQRLRRRDQHVRMADAVVQRPSALDEQGSARPLSAGLDGQADERAGLAALGRRSARDGQLPGFFRLGNATFHCWRHQGHGAIDMHRAIQQSCDVYFYTMVRRLGIDKVAGTAHDLGLGEKFDIPAILQRYGTYPDTAWMERRYKKSWTAADSVNASIGQGYVLVNPLQLGVMAARIASGKRLAPRLIGNKRYGPQGGPLDFTAEQLALVHAGMRDVINAPGGTATASRLPVPGIEMAGKTGTAQVRRISAADRAAGRAGALGMSGAWKLRDHAHFIAFAPVEQPKYAIGVTLEHGGHGPAAGVIARDVMTFLFAPDRAMATLAALEQQWGGDIAARMAADAARWQAEQAGKAVGPAPDTPQEAAGEDAPIER